MHGTCDYTVIHQEKLETGPHNPFDHEISFTLGSNAVLNVHSILTFTLGVTGARPTFGSPLTIPASPLTILSMDSSAR